MAHASEEQEPDTPAPGRRTLLREAIVFQVKLVVDGLRDVLLAPVSIVAAIVSLIDTKDGKPGSQFYDVLAYGKSTENWIDLFGALRDREPVELPDDGSLDTVVDRMEAFVVEEYQRGGLTRQAKERLDRALEALHGKNHSNPPS